ncbi:MAG TPA: hypothetical protein VNF73_10265 [Candidatus Saccharimonadales bacterium]|nr:hypothetical protein [Candidatus Saccharimonadales bacterium]
MCGRFVQEHSVAELAGVFEAEPLANQLAAGRCNLAPTQSAAAVVQRADGRRGIMALEPVDPPAELSVWPVPAVVS